LSGRMKIAIAGVALGIILLFIVPWPIALAVMALAIAIPVGSYLALDPSQRRRLREIQRRRQIRG
jgi:hypothetical protein